MPSFEPSPPELVARFTAVAGRHPDAAQRKMFGYPAMFVGGHLVTGLFADRWMIRLRPDDLDELLTHADAAPFSPMSGRTMAGYAVLPRDVVQDDAALDGWLARSIAFGRTLPPK